MRHSNRFVDFNMRHYALRTTRQRFRENQNEQDAGKIKELLMIGQEQLEIVKRQASISQLYAFSSKPLVVEDYFRQKQQSPVAE